MKQLKISKSITNRDAGTLEKYLQDIAKENQDDIYLIKILEKTGKIRKVLEWKVVLYHAILVSRGASNGYDNNYFYNFHTIRNGENETVCARHVGKNEEFTTIEC